MNLTRRLLRQEADALPLLPLPGRSASGCCGIQRVITGFHLSAYDSLVKSAASAGEYSLGLTFVHYRSTSTIHLRSKQGVLDITTAHEYLDNLALADRILGELRQAMEQAGTWDSTTILISSDHWWRTDYWQAVKLENFWTSPTRKARKTQTIIACLSCSSWLEQRQRDL